MALLRYLYGLPYEGDHAEWYDGLSLLPHALGYTVAEKYQIKEPQAAACAKMSDIICINKQNSMRLLESSDLLDAIRTIIAGTPRSDEFGRELLVQHCVDEMRCFVKNENFMATVAELPELGAELLGRHHAGLDSSNDGTYDSGEEDQSEYCENCQEITKVVCSCCGT